LFTRNCHTRICCHRPPPYVSFFPLHLWFHGNLEVFNAQYILSPFTKVPTLPFYAASAVRTLYFPLLLLPPCFHLFWAKRWSRKVPNWSIILNRWTAWLALTTWCSLTEHSKLCQYSSSGKYYKSFRRSTAVGDAPQTLCKTKWKSSSFRNRLTHPVVILCTV
jgi:hypothetical protein